MTNTFYIAYNHDFNRTWYLLLVRDTHFCIACGSDLNVILDSLRRSVKKYRTRERLLRVLSGLEYGGKVPPTTFEQREEWYRKHGEDYEDLVYSTVLEAFREAREEDKKNSPLRKTTTRLKKVGVIKAVAETIEDSAQKDSTPAQDSPKILRKPRVFNYK